MIRKQIWDLILNLSHFNMNLPIRTVLDQAGHGQFD